MLEFNELQRAGVAELADAQDLGPKTRALKTDQLQENRGS
jgi:hypothetical protein